MQPAHQAWPLSFLPGYLIDTPRSRQLDIPSSPIPQSSGLPVVNPLPTVGEQRDAYRKADLA